MKVALFSESYLPYLNGVSVSIRILHEELTRRGYEVWIYAPRFRDYHDPYPTVRRFPSFTTPFEPDYPIAWLLAPRLWREFRKQGFDVVHTHTPFFVGMAGASWAKRLKIPLVSTYHTLYEEYLHYVPPIVPKSLVRRVLRWHLKRYYESVDAVITPSEIGAEVLRKYGVQKPITPIRNPVLPFPEVSKAEARAKLGIPAETWMLLYVGRMAPEKNVSVLLQAIPHIVRGCPNARLWLVGPGPALEDLKAQAHAMNLSQWVHFTGAVPRDEVSLYLLAADLFVFPSITESQGLVLDEAQAAGLPCIVANGGGAPEAVDYGQTGLVVEPTPEAFVEAVLHLTRHPEERDTLRQRAIRKRELLSVPSVVDRIIGVYRSAIALHAQGESARVG
ncbi:MAG: glycosyltransferase family 4 protein [Fimbriimonadales bacterium]|nr:glycosyltransferase family 4 protein [Fimbriimonadales bacterium]